MKQIISIQYLRGIAATMVVVYHLLEVDSAEPYFLSLGPCSTGAFGVDIFFVISGFIMWTVAVDRPSTPLAFLKRRVIRIVPMYWIITLATAFLSTSGAIINLPDPEQLFRSLLFIPQWNPDLINIIAPIVKVGWTLELEIFFYIIFALTLLLPIGLRLVTGVSILIFLAISGFVFGPFERATLEIYTDSMVVEFAYGMVLGSFYPSIRNTVERFPRIWVVGLALTISALIVLPEDGVFLRTRGIVCGVPALMIVLGALLMENLLRVYPIRLLSALGDSSYSTYLFHLITLVITQKTIGVTFAKSAPWFALITQTLICVVVGYIIYHVAEKPITHHIRRWSR